MEGLLSTDKSNDVWLRVDALRDQLRQLTKQIDAHNVRVLRGLAVADLPALKRERLGLKDTILRLMPSFNFQF